MLVLLAIYWSNDWRKEEIVAHTAKRQADFQVCEGSKMLKTLITKAATRGVLQKSLFLNISQFSQENICVGVSF